MSHGTPAAGGMRSAHVDDGPVSAGAATLGHEPGGTAHTFGCEPAPHTCGGVHVPQLS